MIMALTQKEISASHYRSRKDNGLCPRCGKSLDREGHYCSECLEKNRKYRQENRDFYRKNHICTVCGKEKVPDGERVCPECRAKRFSRKSATHEQKIRYSSHFRSQQNLLYQQRVEEGICTRCGKRKALSGKKKCGICLGKDAEIHRRKRMEKGNIRTFRSENHLCYFCGNKIDLKSGNICSKCYEKFRENGMKHGGKNQYWKKENKLIFRGKKI